LGGKLFKVGADAAAHYPALAYTPVDATTCAALPKAPGELTRFLRAGDGSIYYVANGVKRPISSYPAYLALGGTSANTIQTSAFALGLIPTGSTWSAAQQAAQQAAPPATPTAPAVGDAAAPTSAAATPATAGGDGTSTPAGATP
jgi:hypothetical protein